MANSLTREVGLKVGPVMFEVLVKHYFDRLKKDVKKDDSGARLKEDELLYDEAFSIVKAFMNASTMHTVEELQSFSNTRTPSPPWTHVVRTLVPLSCCEDAAPYLIKALGGEDVAKDLVGGVKWWQVRGINGVDAQWITAKKDWQEAKRKHKQKMKEGSPASSPSATQTEHDAPSVPKEDAVYEKDMDAMRCILYLHGGGYYFGSVDQERYSIQRHARKINGRVFAINYRLAPQYPFPCGLQDAIAAYLFLIRPPPGSDHVAVDPAHIIIAGDSAGGGLALALLQVLRDSGLPQAAGGVLISPWCDLTHSFPSIHLNTTTDIIPESGLSFHKPSTLWPPPSPEVRTRVHASLRSRIRQVFGLDEAAVIDELTNVGSEKGTPHNPDPVETDPTASQSAPPRAPIGSVEREKVGIRLDSGEVIEVNEQLHFYAQNSLLAHPLVSPATSYLGGLPPLFVIAGDKEVLRDEIIYSAHKAAYPEKYPITDEARALYPSLNGIEERFIKPTSVHLQVYDGTPHVLPVLFSFTTPAKFCFRGIASFCKFVTNMPTNPLLDRNAHSTSSIPRGTPPRRRSSLFAGFKSTPPRVDHPVGPAASAPATLPGGIPTIEEPVGPVTTSPEPMSPGASHPDLVPGQKSLGRSLSARLSRAISRRRSHEPAGRELSPVDGSIDQVNGNHSRQTSGDEPTSFASSGDVAGPRFKTAPSMPLTGDTERTAGEVVVYAEIKDHANWECRMIRERVSTAGVIRPLEPESELDAFQLPSESVAHLSELTIRRYIRDRTIFEKKFAHTVKTIDKHRWRNLERAKEDTIRRLAILRQTIARDRDPESKSSTSSNESGCSKGKKKDIREKVLSNPGWAWAWALDDSEVPPPSSIVSRRDTEEARKLAAVADQAIDEEDQTFSGNNLWSVVINFLTITPGRSQHTLHQSRRLDQESEGSTTSSTADTPSAEPAAVDVGANLTKKRSVFWKGGDFWGRHSSKPQEVMGGVEH